MDTDAGSALYLPSYSLLLGYLILLLRHSTRQWHIHLCDKSPDVRLFRLGNAVTLMLLLILITLAVDQKDVSLACRSLAGFSSFKYEFISTPSQFK